MQVRLNQGRIARARRAHGVPVDPSSQDIRAVADLPESDPESWPQYVVDCDEDGVPHIVDVDASIEWDGWRIPEFDQTKFCVILAELEECRELVRAVKRHVHPDDRESLYEVDAQLGHAIANLEGHAGKTT